MEDKCKQILFVMGQDRSPGWGGISVELFKEFWEELSNVVARLDDKAFLKGVMEKSVAQG